ncbi:3'-5' exonuclease [Hallella absiana]|uniref:3'-5' exonuclease n=1 Tax=Hallella absiana TaxID=2925336 RepID=UPI0021C90A6A|nr:3'-5' exonuclease [Hallella absiana]
MESKEKTWTPDRDQQEIIGLSHGRHLVLAPPGCGKTQILAERVRKAHAEGVAYSDMLCLTFTNRAARGMRERISSNLGDPDTAQVFVGNVHRFCARFLFENAVVPGETSVIDDDTTVSILATYLNEDEDKVMGNYQRRSDYNRVVFISHLMYEIEHGLPKALRQHPDSLSSEDIAALRAICKMQRREFTREALLDIYHHNDFYRDAVLQPDFDAVLRPSAQRTLQFLRYAHAYQAYKRQNLLLDFEDLLLLTYFALHDNADYKRYPWIQVDEVQDLNPLQLAIIDELATASLAVASSEHESQTPSAAGCVIYLGDEQQAIFSFMGAKLSTLGLLKERCKGNIHYLGQNHRSPKYLLDFLNRYAVNELHTDPELLPQTADCDDKANGRLAIVASDDVDSEFNDIAHLVEQLRHAHPEETVAVIVNANRDADAMSRALTAQDIRHFKVSGSDLFASDEVKLLLAHLTVLDNDQQFLAWARLFKGLQVCATHASARRLMHQLKERAVSPAELLTGDKTMLQRFVETYQQEDIVVFDTETTGLNVFEDDVVQIAAERIRQGRVVDTFSVYVETDREIPSMLGDIVNPIIEERKHQQLHSHAEALRMFLNFAHGSALLGHNADYDYHIMQCNVARYLPGVSWVERQPVCFDSLRLIRLLRPDLKAFKLKLLLQELHLEGQNSHLADDDVFATVSLVNYCYEKAQEVVPQQQEFLARKGVAAQIKLLRDHYASFYTEALQRLYQRRQPTEDPALVAELQLFSDYTVKKGWMKQVKKLPVILRFLAYDIIDVEKEHSLKEQLDSHVMELNTFKEADLCGSTTIEDRVFVSTIHKAKGLEFDNVIVFDVVDGRIPNYYNGDNQQLNDEDARKLYVAMSRAKRRLFIAYSKAKLTAYGIKQQRLSRFLDSVKEMMG